MAYPGDDSRDVLVVSPHQVLVVSRHQDEKLLQALSRGGFKTITASDSDEGMRMLYERRPSAVIMSDDLSPIGGKQLYVRLGEMAVVPSIVVGHKNEVERAVIIEGGADLYLDSQTSHDTLIVYLRSLLNRSRSYQGSLRFDAERKTVALGDLSIGLTDMEFRLLSCLAFNEGRMMPYRSLLAEVWGRETSLEAVHLYVRRLKHKLGIDSAGRYRLVNRRGKGYCFSVDRAYGN